MTTLLCECRTTGQRRLFGHWEAQIFCEILIAFANGVMVPLFARTNEILDATLGSFGISSIPNDAHHLNEHGSIVDGNEMTLVTGNHTIPQIRIQILSCNELFPQIFVQIALLLQLPLTVTQISSLSIDNTLVNKEQSDNADQNEDQDDQLNNIHVITCP